MSFGSIFSPDQQDLALLIPVQSGLLSLFRRYFAISMLSLPNHHIAQDLFSRVFGKILLQTISENSDECYDITLKKWIFYGKLWQRCILRSNLLLPDTMNENVRTW